MNPPGVSDFSKGSSGDTAFDWRRAPRLTLEAINSDVMSGTTEPLRTRRGRWIAISSVALISLGLPWYVRVLISLGLPWYVRVLHAVACARARSNTLMTTKATQMPFVPHCVSSFCPCPLSPAALHAAVMTRWDAPYSSQPVILGITRWAAVFFL